MALPVTTTGPVTGGAVGAAVQPQPAPMPAGPQVPPTGLIGSEQALQGGLQGALSALLAGMGQGRGDIMGMIGGGQRGVNSMIQGGQEGFRPFMQQGQGANSMQAALSGALGPAAQAEAFRNFNSSPGQQFLQDRGEQAVLRNASATGGLGGGRVMQELQRQGIGFAQQDLNDQFARLGNVADRGMQGAQGIGQLAGIGAGVKGQLAGQGAALLGGLGEAGGMAGAQLFRGTGQDVAAGRTNAGNRIADSVAGATSALSNLRDQQGRGASDMIGGGANTLAGLLSGAGAGSADDIRALMQYIAQISGNQGNQIAGLPGIPGINQNPGMMEGLGAAASGAGMMMMASDARLKTNIRRVGTTPGGTPWYSWKWRVATDQPAVGVLAHEVPEASVLGDDGYLYVDYSKVT